MVNKKLAFLFEGHPWYDYLDATVVQGLQNCGYKVYGFQGNKNNYATPHQGEDYDVVISSVIPSNVEHSRPVPRVFLWGGDTGTGPIAAMPSFRLVHFDVAFIRDYRGGASSKIYPINFGIEDRYYCSNGKEPKQWKKRKLDIVFLGRTNNCQGRQKLFDAIKKAFDKEYKILIDGQIFTKADPHWAHWLNTHCCHDQRYFDTLADAKIILSPMGAGPDCARHWEAFASGGLPLIERMPTTMCEPVVDGVDCLLFSSPEEMVAKARFALEKQDVGSLVSAVAYQRGKQHHTTKARAKYILDTMQKEGLL